MYVPYFKRHVEIRPDTTDAAVLDDVYRGYHIPPTINPRTVLDLGCNIGLTMLDYQRMWPDAVIIGVELDIDNAIQARINTGMVVHNAAVAGVDGIRQYEVTAEAWAKRLSEHGQYVRAMSLSSILDMVGDIDFVKMDIEGAEWEAIEADGWQNRIGSLLIELHRPDHQEACDEMGELLKSKGFTAVRHQPHWSAVWAVRV